MNLCETLQAIVDSELMLGNKIEAVREGGFTKVDVIVYLKLPFHKRYEVAELEFYRNLDTHYDPGDGYTSAVRRQAVEAPFA
jgi:hypothetical protein